MSVEFSLSDNNLTLEEWNATLEGWAEELGDAIYRAPRFAAEDELPSIVVLGKGSVRGVYVKLIVGQARFVLNAMASRADWRLAFELMMLVQIRGGGTILRDDGRELPLRELTPESADEQAFADLTPSLAAFRKAFKERASTTGVAKLPVGGFRVPLRAEDIPENPEPSNDELALLEKTLSERVHRYTQAAHAKTFVLENGLRLSSWGYRPTLITQAHYLVIREADHPIPIERARAILGARVERIGPDLWYFPRLNKKDRAKLVAQLRRATVLVPGFVKPKLSTAQVKAVQEEPDEEPENEVEEPEAEVEEPEALAAPQPSAAAPAIPVAALDFFVETEDPNAVGAASEEPFLLTELIDGGSLEPEPEEER